MADLETDASQSGKLACLLMRVLRHSILLLGTSFVPTVHGDIVQPELDDYKISVYSKEFAERFAIDSSGINKLGENLHAIEFIIERLDGIYSCFFTMYIDSDMPLAYPEDGRGSRSYGKHMLSFNNSKNWNSPVDKQYLIAKDKKYRRRAFISSSDFSKKNKSGFRYDLAIYQFVRDYLPGMSLITLHSNVCDLPSSEAVEKDIGIFIEREGGKDYSKYLDYDQNDFLQFWLPRNFIKEVMQEANKAMRVNKQKWNSQIN